MLGDPLPNGTVSALGAAATTDTSEAVRTAAVMSLNSLYDSNPGIINILTGVSEKDASADVRQLAAQFLASSPAARISSIQ